MTAQKTYRVILNTDASAFITVTVPEGETEEDTREAAIDAAYDKAPLLCAHCAGWGQDAGVELGEWEADEGDDAIVEVDQ